MLVLAGRCICEHAALWIVGALVAAVVVVSTSMQVVQHGDVEAIASFRSSWSGSRCSPLLNASGVADGSRKFCISLAPTRVRGGEA